MRRGKRPVYGSIKCVCVCVCVMQPYTTSDDLRTCDAARGCLLQLGELQDIAAKVALQATLPQSLAPMLTQQLTSGPRGSESGGAAGEPCFDVLLSYKRQDAHALARALHTTLVLRGIGCLLDYGRHHTPLLLTFLNCVRLYARVMK